MHRHHHASTGFISRILALALLSSGLLLVAAPSTLATTKPALVVPAASVTPTAVTFSTQTVGNPSTPHPVTFTADVTDTAFGAPLLTGTNASDFSVTPTAGCGAVALGGDCLVTVTFTPSAAGMRTATLTVTDTATGVTPTAVPLVGTGQVVATGVTPAVLNFYNQAIGTTSTARAVALVNGGPTTITVSSVGIITGTAGTTKPDFSIVPGSDTCTGKQVGPNAACTVGIVFRPSAEGIRTGFIYFVDTGTGSPHLGLLVGRGVSTAGYWLSASDGGVFTFGPGASFFGSTGSIKLNQPIVGIAGTPDSGGYWEVASDGGIFAFGNAKFFGSTGSIKLNKPIVGMATTPSGLGYWLVASDGGVFAFGDAGFFGSTGSIKLNKPIVGIAPTQDGLGYWMVATDGGIFAFGDAAFKGSTGSIILNKPIVGMAPTPDGSGYWLVASDGGVFAFSAPFLGSTGSIKLNKPIVGVAATPTGLGYWMVATDGGIFAFGDAPFFGSTGSITLNKPIVGMAPAL
jgi:hypothetical protein